MDVGTLVIKMAADLASLKSDMDTAKREVASASATMSNSVAAVGGAFKALAVVAGVASLGSWAKSAIDAADEAFNLSQKIGVTSTDIGGLKLAFEQAGLSTETLKKTFALLSKDIAESGNKFKALGIELKNTDGSAKSNIQVFGELADRFRLMKDGTDKTALAVEVFGKKIGPDLLPILNQGSEGLALMRKAADELGLTIDAETAEAADRFNDSLDLMKTRMTTVMLDALTPLLPKVAEFTDRMAAASGSSSTLATLSKLLGGVFSLLVNTVLGAIGVFDTLAIRIEAVGKATVKFVTGDFAGASAEIKKGSEEIQRNWEALFGSQQRALAQTQTAADKTAEAYSNSAAAAKESLMKIEEAEKARQATLKATTAAYEKVLESLDKATLAAREEIEAGTKLTDAKKLELDVRATLNEATLQFTATQRRQIESSLAEAMAALDQRDAARELIKAKEELQKAAVKETEDLQKKIEEQAKENAAIGKTAAEIERLEIARLLDAAAMKEQLVQQRLQAGINDELTQEYAKQAKGLRDLATLKEEGIHTKMAVEARDAWKETTKSILDGLTDALMRAFENGKGFMQAFRDVLKNTFKTLVLEPTIRAVMAPIASVLGGIMGSAPGLAGAATGATGGGSGLLGTVGQLAGFGGAFGAGIAGGVGGLLGLGGASLGSTLGGIGYGLSGAAGLGGIAGSLGAIVGTLGPIALGIGLLVKGFSRGPKQTTAEGISGTIGGGEVDAQKFAEWIKKGGWFRSDKKGTDYSSLSAETAAALNQTAAAVFNQSKVYVEALGLSLDGLKDVSTQIRVQLGKDEKENEKAIAAAFESYRLALAEHFSEALLPFQNAGETLADTLQRLAALQSFSEDINQVGGIFSTVALLSVDAKEQLLAFAGGIESFIAKTQAFVANYYSQDEQFGIQAAQIKSALMALGITEDVNTRDQFRKLVESIDVSTEEGRKQLIALLDLSAKFAPVGQYLEQNKKTLDELAKMAPQTAILKSILDDATKKAEWQQRQDTRDDEFYKWYRENWNGYREFTDTQYAQDAAYYEWTKTEALARADFDTRQLEATDRLYGGISGVSDVIREGQAATVSSLDLLRQSVEAGLAAVSANTRQTATLLDSWDDNGSLLTTSNTP